MADDEVVRVLEGAAAVLDASSAGARGDFGLAAPLPFALALRNGDGVRPTTGGVAVRDGGGVGRLIAGLSQDEKKSSSSASPAASELPSFEVAATASVITTSSGYLCYNQSQHPPFETGIKHTLEHPQLLFA